MQTEGKKTLAELEIMTEGDLEVFIEKKTVSSDDACFMLGKCQIEGSFPDRIPRNEKKGLNWIKQAVDNNHVPAIEYKAYFDIRFDTNPQLNDIVKALEQSVAETKSAKAACTLAEVAHGQKDKDKAAKLYAVAADQGDIVGLHWLGVYYLEGYGVSQNLDKGEANLLAAAKAGNGQSHFQLFILYSSFELKKNVAKAYKHLIKALQLGVTHWEQCEKFFLENFDAVSPVFVAIKKHDSTLTKAQIVNLHEAWLSELKDGFTVQLGKDQLYACPAGFVTDQQIWMVGVLMKYFMRQAMHFEHEDFMTALRADLGPLLSETGLWMVHNYEIRQQDKGNAEKRKKAKVAQDLIGEFMANGMEKFSKSSMYNMKNKYCPKKLPNEKKVRADIAFIYSWTHYAPLQWFQHSRLQEDKVKGALKNNSGSDAKVSLCSWCQSPESASMPHKRCSQCKQRLYCSNDCQRFDWKNGHKNECKAMAAAAAKK